MSKKFPYSGYGGGSQSGGYNYRKLIRAEAMWPTEKQIKLISDLKETCERVGIDLSELELRTKTKRDATGSIKALYTILNNNGFDGWGNPIKTYHINDANDVK